MSDQPNSSLHLVGLTGTGKTSFLVALDVTLDCQTDPNGLIHSGLAEDRTYLHPLKEQWLRGEVFDRTSRLIPPPPHQLLVKHPTNGATAGFNIPDLAGESFNANFVTRSIPIELWERLRKASGLLLFLHCNHNADHTILEHECFIEPELSSESSSETKSKSALGSPVSDWKLEDAAMQVKLVELFQFLMAAKFIAATNVAVRDAVEKAGPYAIESAFRWFERDISDQFLPSPAWREALAAKAVDRLRDPKSLSSSSLALCAWFIPPEAVRQSLTASRQDIQQLAQQPLELLPKPLRLHTAFLLVTLGLRATEVEGVKLLKRGYFEVYDALATSTASNDKFTWESWLLLSAELPKPGIWRDWDKCDRLRRGVRQWLLKYVKTGNPLLDATASKRQSEIARQTLSDDGDNLTQTTGL